MNERQADEIISCLNEICSNLSALAETANETNPIMERIASLLERL